MENESRTAPGPQSATLTIWSPLERTDLPGLLARAYALLAQGDFEVLRCEVCGVAADAVAVDALARLVLVARRSGAQVRLRGACAELTALVKFMGLAGVLLVGD
ncbi:MAG TPA: hypothetical protein VID70_10600 [Solirubrobacteraceae bacterium]|jgi:ABC-type transporter Mla MlaB component